MNYTNFFMLCKHQFINSNKSCCLRAIDDKRTYPVQVLFSLRYDVCGSLQEHLCRINTIWIKVFGICRAFLL